MYLYQVCDYQLIQNLCMSVFEFYDKSYGSYMFNYKRAPIQMWWNKKRL